MSKKLLFLPFVCCVKDEQLWRNQKFMDFFFIFFSSITIIWINYIDFDHAIWIRQTTQKIHNDAYWVTIKKPQRLWNRIINWPVELLRAKKSFACVIIERVNSFFSLFFSPEKNWKFNFQTWKTIELCSNLHCLLNGNRMRLNRFFRVEEHLKWKT
jgi:hypothetical protein